MKKKQDAHEQMDALREALLAKRNHTDKPLHDLLGRCFLDSSRFRCRSPACVRCRFINIRRQQRETFELLGHFPNNQLAFVTVVLGATSDIRGVSTMIEKSRRDTKNRFVAARSKDDRWNDTYLRAWHEVDAVGAEHMPLLPPDRRDLLPALAPMASNTLSATWLPTWHGLLFLNGLDIEEVTGEFQQQWKLEHQVFVEPLDTTKTVKANLDKLASYANKFHCSVSLIGGWKEPWPLHWQTEFFGWLHDGKRNAFEGLRLSVNQALPKDEIEVCQVVEGLSPMPFAHAFSGVPMHYNTGAWA